MNKKNEIYLWFSVYSTNVYRPFLGYLCWLLKRDTGLFFRYQRFLVYESVHMVCRKNANKIFIYIVVVEIFNCRFYLKIWYSFKHFASCRVAPVPFLQCNLTVLIPIHFLFCYFLLFLHQRYITHVFV